MTDTVPPFFTFASIEGLLLSMSAIGIFYAWWCTMRMPRHAPLARPPPIDTDQAALWETLTHAFRMYVFCNVVSAGSVRGSAKGGSGLFAVRLAVFCTGITIPIVFKLVNPNDYAQMAWAIGRMIACMCIIEYAHVREIGPLVHLITSAHSGPLVPLLRWARFWNIAGLCTAAGIYTMVCIFPIWVGMDVDPEALLFLTKTLMYRENSIGQQFFVFIGMHNIVPDPRYAHIIKRDWFLTAWCGILARLLLMFQGWCNGDQWLSESPAIWTALSALVTPVILAVSKAFERRMADRVVRQLDVTPQAETPNQPARTRMNIVA